MNSKKIAVLAGDGIGEEVMVQALRVLARIGSSYGHEFVLQKALVGGAAFDVFGEHFPEETKELCRQSDAVLFGSVGGPVAATDLKWKNCEVNSILAIRKEFSFNANFRPAKIYPQLAASSPLKPEIVSGGVDMLIVRELLGDIYFGGHRTFEEAGKRVAEDVARYDEDQIAAIAKVAFEAARKRSGGKGGSVTSVDKANVLGSSRLWRKVVEEVHSDYPDVSLRHIYVDNCAMQLVVNPRQFDVLLAPNMFGDILSDLAAVLPGSLGLLASASFNQDGFGLYEPSGGSAQDIAGQGVANPLAQILCVAMMLRFSFGLEQEAKVIEDAVDETLSDGLRTRDIYSDGCRLCNTVEMADAVLDRMRN